MTPSTRLVHYRSVLSPQIGKPLIDRANVVSLIANTTTKTGLLVQAQLDERNYQTGIKVSDPEMKQIDLHPDSFHGEWNYLIKPN